MPALYAVAELQAWPRNDWALALIDCAIAGTLDRENAAQFVEWAEAQSWDAERRAI